MKVKSAGLSYSRSFAEWEAAFGSGLDLYRWHIGGYPKEFMSKVIAWWELHNLADLHRQDANYVPLKGKK